MKTPLRALALSTLLLLGACATQPPQQPLIQDTTPPARKDFSLQGSDKARTLVFSERLLFGANKAEVRNEAAALIKRVATLVNERQYKKVTLAYADGNSSAAASPNEPHLQALKAALTTAGINAETIAASASASNSAVPIPTPRIELTLSDSKTYESPLAWLPDPKQDETTRKLEWDFLTLASTVLQTLDNPTPVAQSPNVAPTNPPQTSPTTTPLSELIKQENERLSTFKGNLLQILGLNETLAGFKPKPRVMGIFELKASKQAKLRLALSQNPGSPIKLNYGSYLVNVTLAVDFLEKRSCTGTCPSASEEKERSITKNLQFKVSPQNKFSESATLSLSDGKPAADARNYQTSYEDLVLTVRRMSITPIP